MCVWVKGLFVYVVASQLEFFRKQAVLWDKNWTSPKVPLVIEVIFTETGQFELVLDCAVSFRNWEECHSGQPITPWELVISLELASSFQSDSQWSNCSSEVSAGCSSCELFGVLKMRSPLSKPSKTVHPTGTSAKYMFKTCREFSCTYLTKWTDLSDLENHWSLQGTFDIPKLDFLKTKLGNNSAVVKRNEMPILSGILRLPNNAMNLKLPNYKIKSQLTRAAKNLKRQNGTWNLMLFLYSTALPFPHCSFVSSSSSNAILSLIAASYAFS